MLGQASPGPDIGADASDTRPEHRHHSRLAMHTRCARLGARASDIRSWSTDTIACGAHVLRKTLASGDGGDASVGVWLHSTLPALFSSAEYGGVVRKGCHLQDWQAIIGNYPTRFGSC